MRWWRGVRLVYCKYPITHFTRITPLKLITHSCFLACSQNLSNRLPHPQPPLHRRRIPHHYLGDRHLHDSRADGSGICGEQVEGEVGGRRVGLEWVMRARDQAGECSRAWRRLESRRNMVQVSCQIRFSFKVPLHKGRVPPQETNITLEGLPTEN